MSDSDRPDDDAVFHVKHPEDQAVIDTITRNVRTIVRSQASKKAWETRKRMQAARQRAKDGGERG